MVNKVALYARVSMAAEESVSVERQLLSGRRYAAARGWEVVGEFFDDGVSATRNRPDQREQWRALLSAELEFDAVLIWKVDRLARKVSDFLDADGALQKRGAALVAVEDPIDLTTAQGRAFATMLAVFAELEAASMGARVRASRMHLIASGRAVGGLPGYGWMHSPNPDGPGFVMAQDPVRIKWVRGMARRSLRGDSLHSICRWLERSKAPLPRHSTRKGTAWGYDTVRNILMNPLVAGLIDYPYGQDDIAREWQVLRRPSGVPIVHRHLAVISLGQRKALLDGLASRSKARRVVGPQSALLDGLVWCGACRSSRNLSVGSVCGDPLLRCAHCHLMIRIGPLAAAVERRLLGERGTTPMWHACYDSPEVEAAAVRLEAAELQIERVAYAMTRDGHAEALSSEMQELKDLRAVALETVGSRRPALEPSGLRLEQVWLRCRSDEERHALLSRNIERITVLPGGQGLPTEARLEVKMRTLGPTPVAASSVLHRDPAPQRFYDTTDGWLGIEAAFEQHIRETGCSHNAFVRAVQDGTIERRECRGGGPYRGTLSRASVIEFAAEARVRQQEAQQERESERREWVSWRGAASLTGSSLEAIGRAGSNGQIARRYVAANRPSLSRESVLEFADTLATSLETFS